jgi:hypothetical protein
MTDESKTQTPKIEHLELNKETLQDLTESEQEAVAGGALPTLRCQSVAFSCNPATDCCLATRQNPATC